MPSRRCPRCPPCAVSWSTSSARWWPRPSAVVVEGRDIGTVVLPDATLKIYLTAAPEIRAAAAGRPARASPTRPRSRRSPRTCAAGTSTTAAAADSPLRPAADAVIVDSTDLDRDAVIARVCELAGTAVRAEELGMTETDGGPLPVVAIVGRPNVGKSTLVNRILGRRAAVVQDIPGVTRDRISYEALWNGKRFTVVDTGGWDPKAIGLGASITRQAQYAMETADVIVFVVDSSGGRHRHRPRRRADPAPQRPAGDPRGQQGRRRAQRGQRRRAVVARAGGAAAGQRAARPLQR